VDGGGEDGGGEDGGGPLLGGMEPVQVVPLRANPVGAGLLPVQDPLKPNEAVPDVAMAPLWLTLRAVTWPPPADTVAFQAWVTRCPAE
jgi:hypothetical protein